ncbi:MAG: prepilin-type N-terminal cleavage/methylation domain-containing protein [bacterium]|nr:prepilin-type N-terminal cleavage/methylation domain-containing protein [bacterium]
MRNARGFTLIEVIIALSIMAIFTAVALPNFGRLQNTAKQTACTLLGQSVQMALEDYYVSEGMYPPGNDIGITELMPLLNGTNSIMVIPENPYTGRTYTPTDQNGRVLYTQKDEGTGYELVVYGKGPTELRRLSHY